MKPGLIFLTGMMGSGKSTLGRLLAKKLGWRFEDTDLLVKRRAKKTVAAVFQDDGEAAFRALESRALKGIRPPAVVATGGGIILKRSNRKWMRDHGLVVCLKISPRRIARRLNAHELGKRPLLKGESIRLWQLARTRAPLYRQAHLAVLSNAAPAALAARVLLKIKSKYPRVLSVKTAR